MLEILQQKMQLIQAGNGHIITWGVALSLLSIAAFLLRSTINKYREERRIRKTIQLLGRDSLHDVLIPDGLGGKAYIEHLLLTPMGILVIMVRRYRGVIFAADKIDQWTQVVGKRSYKFPNPLHLLEMELSAVKSIIPKMAVLGHVVFSGDSQFPKGKPDNVSLLSQVKNELAEKYQGDVPATLQEAWEKIKEGSQNYKHEHNDELVSMTDDEAHTGSKMAALLLIILSCLWVIWRVQYSDILF